MTPIRLSAPIAALLFLSAPAWAQASAAPAQPQPDRQVVRQPAQPQSYQDTQEAADALNGQEMAQSPIVASPPRPIAVPVYNPPPAYYPPPPPPPNWRPY